MKTKIILIGCLFILIVGVANATIIHVPADQPTIQAGINFANDADTVLVQPGTYIENINFNGKNIVVSSLFLTTQDTSYISQTVIDGNQNGSVVTFENGEDSTAVLSGFTLKNGSGTYADPSASGYDHYLGGGVFCVNSSPNLKNLKIMENTIEQGNGAGIYCYNSCPNLENVTISNNSAEWSGGGLFCRENSNISLINVAIINNSAGSSGGGIYLHSHSNALLENVIISGNIATGSGGGIQSYSSDPSMENVIISNNSGGWGGGGIYWYNSYAELANVTISENSAEDYGGGIYFASSIPIFDSDNRCNIYLNSANLGNDLYNLTQNAVVDIIVDTFTVMNPTSFHAFPINHFTFDILHGIHTQVNYDLYVSPDGDNSNSGLSWNDPLKTITYALSIIQAGSLNPLTIHFDFGIFSSGTNGESFPLICNNYVSLLGIEEAETILDGGGESNLIICSGVQGITIEHLTITNGSWYGSVFYQGGGIYCDNSNINLVDLTISNNQIGYGGGIYYSNSNSILINVTVTDNSAKHVGGISCSSSSLILMNTIVSNNFAGEEAGGIYCYDSNVSLDSVLISDNHAGDGGGGGVLYHQSNLNLVNVLISGNSASSGGGIYCSNSNSSLENVTFSNNSAEYYNGGGIYYHDGSMNLVNCILWNDSPEEIYIYSSFVTATYSDIQGGWTGIGNIDADPLFADPVNGDFHLTWANFPIPDSTKSPCIDTGDPNSPLDPDSTRADMGAFYFDQNQQGVEDKSILSTKYLLYQNYPNPFSTSTTISFNLATKLHENSRIKIYNIKGQLVKVLECGESLSTKADEVYYSILWDSKDENGNQLSNGIYLYCLEINGRLIGRLKKAIILK